MQRKRNRKHLDDSEEETSEDEEVYDEVNKVLLIKAFFHAKLRCFLFFK